MKSILEKVEDKEYFNSLSNRSKKELLFSIKYIPEEELQNISSIRIAYKRAREKWIKDNIDTELQDKFLNTKRPISNIFRNI